MGEVWFFLPYIILLGIVTSYTDIKYGKIRNKWLLLGLIYAFIVYSIIIFLYWLDPTVALRKKYLIEILTNFLFSAVLGFCFWCWGIWTAGDGKLFITYSILIPVSVYSYGYLKWVPSTTLFLNTFIVGLIFMASFMLLKLKRRDFYKLLISFVKDIINPKKAIDTIVFLFMITWLVKLLLSPLQLDKNAFLIIVLSAVVFSILEKRIGKDYIFGALIISILRLMLDKSVYSLEFLKNFIFLIIIWSVLRQFFKEEVLKFGQKIFSREIAVDKLKEGMLLTETIVKKGEKYERKIKPLFSMYKGFIDEETEGLTKWQIEKLKKTGIKKIKVAQTIPFAPFLFFGAMLTIFAKGNIFIVLKILLSKLLT